MEKKKRRNTRKNSEDQTMKLLYGALAVLVIVLVVALVFQMKDEGLSVEKESAKKVNKSVSAELTKNVSEEEEPADDEKPDFLVVDETETEGYTEVETETEEPSLPTPPDIDINSWEYILVNSENKIDENFVPQTAYASSRSSSTEQDIRIVDALNTFAQAAEAQGLQVFLSSGYRSYADQNYTFNLKLQQYDYDTAATIVAPPGTSEHQTGLCCDITDIYRSPKNSDLENTETYKWMSAHCAEYGFIVRYPKNKEDITKIIYEPWHFRYVGQEAATYIMENDLTLEEFVALYK